MTYGGCVHKEIKYDGHKDIQDSMLGQETGHCNLLLILGNPFTLEGEQSAQNGLFYLNSAHAKEPKLRDFSQTLVKNIFIGVFIVLISDK